MNSVKQALRNSLQYWPALGLFYLGNIFSALILVVLPALNLLGPAHFTTIRDAADGIDAWAIMDELMPLADQMRQNSPLHVTDSTATALLLVGLVLFAAPLATWSVNALLSGGLLLTYAEAPAPFSLKRFLWGCRHWWSTFWLGLF